MNNVVMCGRLTSDPVTRYGGADNTAVSRFNIAVDRRRKIEGQPTADFFNCVAFGKQGEFVEKFLKKGVKVNLQGEIQNNNYEKGGQTQYSVNIIVNQIEFGESKKANSEAAPAVPADADGFMNIPDGFDDESPFN